MSNDDIATTVILVGAAISLVALLFRGNDDDNKADKEKDNGSRQ